MNIEEAAMYLIQEIYTLDEKNYNDKFRKALHRAGLIRAIRADLPSNQQLFIRDEEDTRLEFTSELIRNPYSGFANEAEIVLRIFLKGALDQSHVVKFVF